MRVLENEDYGVSTEEEFSDISFLLHRFCLLAVRSSGYFRPHLEYVLKHHVHMAIERTDSRENLSVVA